MNTKKWINRLGYLQTFGFVAVLVGMFVALWPHWGWALVLDGFIIALLSKNTIKEIEKIHKGK